MRKSNDESLNFWNTQTLVSLNILYEWDIGRLCLGYFINIKINSSHNYCLFVCLVYILFVCLFTFFYHNAQLVPEARAVKMYSVISEQCGSLSLGTNHLWSEREGAATGQQWGGDRVVMCQMRIFPSFLLFEGGLFYQVIDFVEILGF